MSTIIHIIAAVYRSHPVHAGHDRDFEMRRPTYFTLPITQFTQ